MEFIISDNSDLSENETLKFIKQRIIEINALRKEIEMKIKVEQLFELFNQSIISFKEEIDKHFFSIPIFSFYDMNKLFDKIKLLSNGELVTLKNLIEYRDKQIYQGSEKELDSFNQLEKLIEKYTVDKPKSLSISIMIGLKNTLNKILLKVGQ